ncbi:stage II sporulation protein R [Alkaliphilus hydrothermalis]|uniref:Stage II sporulation protein R n=1 Tax=Alkaliphilus hydrothermalis TaxID=1482730 RepID=A0ABS2NSM5_9FIRM|nr:stage II sporulation protein R [Alkaliphilus hydrothermalis]MBM7615952.1 stage II sporulation protein R [Alkaliphilus hydrothermalis]
MYRKLLMMVLVAVITLGSLSIFSSGEDLTLQAQQENNLIRFHVLANSDSPVDQALKLKVRDRIMKDMAEILEDVASIEESRNLIIENIDRIQEIALEELQLNGSDYPVKVVLKEHVFPTRRYGNMVFPAGKYEALRILIGEAEGQNWWCVMFPPLCFIDVKSGLVDEGTKQKLKGALSEEEYQLIYAEVEQQEEIPLQLRSKIFDFIKYSKNHINKMASIF